MITKIYIMISLASGIVNRFMPTTAPARGTTRRSGFTIAELLMVVIIISLIAGVGGGLYMGTYNSLLVKKAARDLVLTAKYARIMAIENQRPYEIRLDAANNGFSLTTTGWNEQTGQTEQTTVRDVYCKPVEFEGNVIFEDIQVAPVSSESAAPTDEQQEVVVFSPNGTAQLAVVQIGDGKNHYTVTINAATGKATMYFGTAEEVNVNTIDLDAD